MVWRFHPRRVFLKDLEENNKENKITWNENQLLYFCFYK